MFNCTEFIQQQLSHHQAELVHKYIKLLLHWNKKTNLTSPHKAKNRLYAFVCEGIALARVLGNNHALKLVDVGSGAGFPGIILLILGFNDCFLIERNNKKAAFLQYIISELELKGRVYNEDITKVRLEYIDVILSKAAMTLESLIKMSQHITGTKTMFIACKNSAEKKLEFETETITLTDPYEFTQDYKFVLYRPIKPILEAL